MIFNIFLGMGEGSLVFWNIFTWSFTCSFTHDILANFGFVDSTTEIYLLFFAARMTGHQQLVNDVKFSVDSRLVASASFDKSIKVWDGRTGRSV
jgi:WD40 repeat protein